MSNGVLRRPEPGDASIVREWLRGYLTDHRRWWEDAFGRPPQRSLDDLVEEDWAALLAGGSADDAFVRVLANPGPVGIVRAMKQRDRYMGFDVGVLAWIFVDPAARGSGISGALMEAAGAWMSAQKVGGRMVYVTGVNGAAIRLYHRFGYRVVDHRMLGQAEI